MSPRIQGGRPGPSDTVFTVSLPPEMSPADVCAVGDALGPYCWFDDAPGGLLCWVDEATIVATSGSWSVWWDALVWTLAGLGADVELGW